MNWHEYNTDKTFVVVKHGGAGEMGSPYYEIEVVYESDNEDKCKLKAEKLNKLDSDFFYCTILNLNSEIGKIEKAKSKKWLEENKHLFKNELTAERESIRISGESVRKISFTDKGWKYI